MELVIKSFMLQVINFAVVYMCPDYRLESVSTLKNFFCLFVFCIFATVTP